LPLSEVPEPYASIRENAVVAQLDRAAVF